MTGSVRFVQTWQHGSVAWGRSGSLAKDAVWRCVRRVAQISKYVAGHSRQCFRFSKISLAMLARPDSNDHKKKRGASLSNKSINLF